MATFEEIKKTHKSAMITIQLTMSYSAIKTSSYYFIIHLTALEYSVSAGREQFTVFLYVYPCPPVSVKASYFYCITHLVDLQHTVTFLIELCTYIFIYKYERNFLNVPVTTQSFLVSAIPFTYQIHQIIV